MLGVLATTFGGTLEGHRLKLSVQHTAKKSKRKTRKPLCSKDLRAYAMMVPKTGLEPDAAFFSAAGQLVVVMLFPKRCQK